MTTLKMMGMVTIPATSDLVVQPGLNFNGRPIRPDFMVLPAGIAVSTWDSSTGEVTLSNTTGAQITAAFYFAEAWHTYERDFGESIKTQLSRIVTVTGVLAAAS